MTTMLVFNTVFQDGIGDFFHFEDLMQSLLTNEKLNHIEILAFVYFNEGGTLNNYRIIQEKLINGLKLSPRIKVFFGYLKDHKEFITDPILQETMKTAVKGFVVSLNDLKLVNIYKNSCNAIGADIPLIFIGEHEKIDCNFIKDLIPKSHTRIKSLGLSSDAFGLKIKEHIPIHPHEALDNLNAHAPVFCEALTRSFGLDLSQCLQQNIFIPVYLNRPTQLMQFLCFITNNLIEEEPKSIVIHLSGLKIKSIQNLNNIEIPTKIKGAYHRNFTIQSINEIDSERHVITLNKDHYTCKIFSGFYLNDIAYEAFYHLSNIALASGDTSLERCISMNILPFYWSTNHHFCDKWKTVAALQTITQNPAIEITEEARQSFKNFFASKLQEASQELAFYYPEPINVAQMVKEWPIVTAWLRANRNFYNQWETIVLENTIAIENFEIVRKQEERLRWVHEKNQLVSSRSLFSIDSRKMFFNLSLLNQERQQEFFGYLGIKDLSRLAITSKTHSALLNNKLMSTKLLMLVVQGARFKINQLLSKQLSLLLLERGDVTDYSGRTFKNITAYEYAYWAKDWHTCRMLELHMDEDIKAITLTSCEKIEAEGLTYIHNGNLVEQSRHCDFTPIKQAYEKYIDCYRLWSRVDLCEPNIRARMNNAFLLIGLMQRDVPAYVAQEYCRSSAVFNSVSYIHSRELPDGLNVMVFNDVQGNCASWFPLIISATAGLGIDRACYRARNTCCYMSNLFNSCYTCQDVANDAIMIDLLDEESNKQLMQSRENLQPLISMHPVV